MVGKLLLEGTFEGRGWFVMNGQFGIGDGEGRGWIVMNGKYGVGDGEEVVRVAAV